MENSLKNVRADVENRFLDINTMINILNCNNNAKVKEQVILKSSLMIMLYNAVEGVFSNLLTEVFDRITENNISIKQLPISLKNIIYTYHIKRIDTNNIKYLEEFRDYTEFDICSISYLELNKFLKLYSGNLDSQSIRDTSKKLSITLPDEMNEPYLLKVKDIRNKLAHGEIIFSNAAQDITLPEMKKICCRVKNYIDKLLIEYENFLSRI